SINDASFTLFEGTNQIAGAVSYIDSVATFDPDANLVYSTVYKATVTTAVTDSAGNNLLSNYIWSFTTEPEPPYVNVTYPNGGENFVTDSTYAITWDYNISENVKIELYKNLVFVDEIAITTCTGYFAWTIPSASETGNDYTVKITSTSEDTVSDESDSPFTIVRSPFVTVTNPDSLGTSWEKGTVQNITWDYNIYEQVKIELFKGVTFVDEVALTSCTGSFDWNIPATVVNGTDYSIKITSESNSAITDVSDNNFEIFGVPVPVYLMTPADDDTLLTRLPSFEWSVSTDAADYQIIVDDSNIFDSPEIDEIVVSNTYTTISELPYGIYFWKVRASNGYGFNDYSAIRSFEILGPPDPPVLLNPADADTIETRTPTVEWNVVYGADLYYIIVDDSDLFDSPLINDSTANNNYPCGISLDDQKFYYWKVSAKNIAGIGAYSGTWSFYLNTTGIESEIIPSQTMLHQNYPNPFNPETTITYDIAEQSQVSINVLNYKGELVASLVNGRKNVGSYSEKWNCSDMKGQTVTSGMYFIVMMTDSYSKVVKALMVK
ncbi:MAG: Ser-Thr-rich GPI-anchored membrane family protein, partial [Candidatus Delongbacteria bacterium]|nr:Ser-Thr-rich GPI-anchored membrane family protein [Candidatus Delongbacteria bacterium]